MPMPRRVSSSLGRMISPLMITTTAMIRCGLRQGSTEEVDVPFIGDEFDFEVVDHEGDPQLELVARKEAARAHPRAAAERHEVVS